MKKYFMIAAVLFAFGLDAGAQRLIPGQIAVDFGGTVWQPYGAEVGVQIVGRSGKLVGRLSGYFDNKATYGSWVETDPSEHTGIVTDLDTRNTDLFASCGYLWCLVHNRTHSVNLWGGCALDLGARFRYVKTEGYKLAPVPSATFSMGVSPELNFEYFPTNSFSMSVFFRPHCQFLFRGSSYKNDTSENWFFPQFGIQFSFYVFAGR